MRAFYKNTMRFKKPTVFFIVGFATILGLFFTNCAPASKSSERNPNLANNEGQVIAVKTETFNFIGRDYEDRLYNLKLPSGDSVYFQFLPACAVKCPVVVISAPYPAPDWSQDSLDLKWLQRDTSGSGYTHKDEDGPGWTSQSVGEIFFQKYSGTAGANLGALYLPNGISVAVVYSRFYGGRNLHNYVLEHVSTVEQLVKFPEVDPAKVGFFGISLGGFVSAHSAATGKVKVKALASVSPLLDLKLAYDYVQSLSGLVSQPNKLQEYQKFFDPYLRRIQDFTKGTPNSNPQAFATYSLQSLKEKLSIPTLAIHDTWDTLVPENSSSSWVTQSNGQVQYLRFQHATAIDWNNFTLDHYQQSEGLSDRKAQSFSIVFLSKLLLPEAQPIQVYYYSSALSSAFTEFRAAQLRGQDISWLKPRLSEWCDPRIQFIDVEQTLSQLNGQQIVQGVIGNIWGVNKPINEICAWVSQQF